ncbi:DUF4446 family protein [Candidatus Gottesmanbacteria bacterium]|nr:DUF4446 family protein [Candidatus Gottesmanbacteria bacterium]
MSNFEFIWVIIGAILIWLLIVSFLVYRYIAHYNRLIAIGGKENLQTILETILTKQKETDEENSDLRNHLNLIQEKSLLHIQKVGILRFNPFEDTGGDQSFVLAILNGKNSGIVLTSLHSRGTTRWYAKNVKEGKGIDHDLSKDEEKAIHDALIIN